MDSRASLGNTNDKPWEQLLGRGAYHCERCNQAWLLITADDSDSPATKIEAHACKKLRRAADSFEQRPTRSGNARTGRGRWFRTPHRLIN